MKKASVAILVSLSTLAGAAYAQDDGITTSTDPSKVADIEQRAQDLQNRQESVQSAPAAPQMHHRAMHHHHKKGAENSGT